MLIRFSDSPRVYDTSKGTLEWVPTLEEFNRRGLKWEDVKVMDKNSVTLTKSPNDPKVFASIEGQQVHIPDEQTFTGAGFDWNKIQITQSNQPTTTQPTNTVQSPVLTTTPTPQKPGEQLYKDESGNIVSIPPEEVAHRARVQRTTYTPYSPEIKKPEIKTPEDYTNRIIQVYQTNFGRTPTQTEINEQNQSLQTGRLTTDSLTQWAQNHPQNISKIGKVSQPETAKGTPYNFPEATDTQLSQWNWELNPIHDTYQQSLYQFWKAHPEMQLIFDSNLKGIQGSRAEGSTMEDWAVTGGWREDPTLLGAYQPTNYVRTAYWAGLRGTDPLKAGALDIGALDWVEAVRKGEITNFNALIGRMQLDSGGEWKDLSESRKSAIIASAAIPPEAIKDIPKFSEFFKKEEVKSEIEADVNKYYDKQLTDYLKSKGIVEKREVEDWARISIGDINQEESDKLLKGEITATDLRSKLEKEGRQVGGEIGEEEERNLTDTQRQFRQAISSAIEGYAARGIARSSFRQEGESQLREQQIKAQEQIRLESERKRQATERETTRALEDIKIKSETDIAELERERAKEKAIELTARQQESLGQYEALSSGILDKEDLGIKT